MYIIFVLINLVRSRRLLTSSPGNHCYKQIPISNTGNPISANNLVNSKEYTQLIQLPDQRSTLLSGIETAEVYRATF